MSRRSATDYREAREAMRASGLGDLEESVLSLPDPCAYAALTCDLGRTEAMIAIPDWLALQWAVDGYLTVNHHVDFFRFVLAVSGDPAGLGDGEIGAGASA